MRLAAAGRVTGGAGGLGGSGDGAGRSLALLRYTTLQLYNKLYLLRFCTVSVSYTHLTLPTIYSV